ncbi:MAG: hypothetical protein WDN45_09555, partial [Caulobacteraceae bacterium]
MATGRKVSYEPRASRLDDARKPAQGRQAGLKALRADDPAAKDRLRAIWPGAPAEPGLRDVQHGLAREYGQESWIALKQALDDLALARKSRAEQVEVLAAARLGRRRRRRAPAAAAPSGAGA